MLTKVHGLIGASTNARPLGLFRLLFGCLVVLRGLYLTHQASTAQAEGVLSIAGATIPHVHVVVTVLWFSLGSALVLGWHSRSAAGLLAALIAGLLLLDPLFYNNHLYLMGLVALVLACAHSGAAFALDARGGAAPAEVPGWPVFLLKAQTSLVYAFAALSKMQEDFVSGLVLHVHLSRGPFSHLLPPWMLESFAVLAAVALATIAIQVVLVGALWTHRWRGHAFLLGVVLHAPMPLLANSHHQAVRLAVFSALMWSLYLLFLHVPRRVRTVRWDPAAPAATMITRGCARLDWLRAFNFQEGDMVTGLRPITMHGHNPPVITVTDPDGRLYADARAVRHLLSQVPVAYLWAALLANPLAERLMDAVLHSQRANAHAMHDVAAAAE